MKIINLRSLIVSTVAAAAAFLGFSAKAALVAEWKGDFTTTEKGGLTLVAGDGNTATDAGITIGDSSTNPIKITGLDHQGVSVIVGITLASDTKGTVVEAYQKNGGCGTYFFIDGSTITGGWNSGTSNHNDTWSANNGMTVTGSMPTSGLQYVGISYNTVSGGSLCGTRLYLNGESASDRKSGLVSTGFNVTLISIGGNPNRSSTDHMLRGATISYIAVYGETLDNDTMIGTMKVTDGSWSLLENGKWVPDMYGISISWVFTGDYGNADWNTSGNWRKNSAYYETSTGKTPACTDTYAPATTDASLKPVLFDGEKMTGVTADAESGKKVVSSEAGLTTHGSGRSVEGWNLDIIVTNNVDLTIGYLRKQQNPDQVNRIVVDSTSKLTVTTFGGGNGVGNHHYHVASEGGLTFGSAYNANTAGTCYYHLGENGSVLYNGGLAGAVSTHTISDFTLNFGDSTQLGKQVLTRKLVGFASNTHTFSYGTNTEVTGVDDAGGAVEIELESAEVTSANAVGDYYIYTDTDGVYVKYVAYAAAENVYTATIDADTTWESIEWTLGDIATKFPWADIQNRDSAVFTLTLSGGAKVTLPASTVALATLQIGGEGTLVFAEDTYINGTVNTLEGAAITFDISDFVQDVASYAVDGLPWTHKLLKTTSSLAGVTISKGETSLSNAYTLNGDALKSFTVTAGESIVGRAISFNIDEYGRYTDGRKLTTTDKIGAVGVPGNLWDSQVGTNGTLSTVYMVDAKGQKAAIDGASITVSGSRGTWCCNTLDYTKNILFGYIDDGFENNIEYYTPTLTVSGVPFTKFRVVVYHSTDTVNERFGHDLINGVAYMSTNSGMEGSGSFETVHGADPWGASGAAESAYDLCHGVNYIVSDVLEATNIVEVIGHRQTDTFGGAEMAVTRAGIAAIQIVEVGVYNQGTKDFAATVTGDATWSTKAGLDVTSGNTWENGLANSITLATSGDTLYTVTFNEDVTAKRISVTGSGKIAFSVAEGATVAAGAFDLSAFTGTLYINEANSISYSLGEATNVRFAPSADLTYTQSIEIGANGTLTFAPAADTTLTMSATVSGEGTINAEGPGTVGLTSVDEASTVNITGGKVVPLAAALRGNYVVKTGCTFDFAGVGNGYLVLTLEGGSLINSSDTTEISHGSRVVASPLTLTADSTMGGMGNFGLIASGYGLVNFEPNGHTLTKTGTNTVYLTQIVATNTIGKIVVAEGALQTWETASNLSTVDLELAEGAEVDASRVGLTVANLKVTGTASADSGVTVSNVLTYVANAEGKASAVHATLGENAYASIPADVAFDMGEVRAKIGELGENTAITVTGTDDEFLAGKIEIPTTLTALPEGVTVQVMDGETEIASTTAVAEGVITITVQPNIITENNKKASDIASMTGRVLINAQDAADGLTFDFDEALADGITGITVFGSVTFTSTSGNPLPLSKVTLAEGATLTISADIDGAFETEAGTTIRFKDVTVTQPLTIGGAAETEGTVVLSNTTNTFGTATTVTSGTATITTANFGLGGTVTVASGATLVLTELAEFDYNTNSANPTRLVLNGTLDLGETQQGLSNVNRLTMGDGAKITGEGLAQAATDVPTALLFAASNSQTCPVSFAEGASIVYFDAPIRAPSGTTSGTTQLEMNGEGVDIVFTKPIVAGSAKITNVSQLTTAGGHFTITCKNTTSLTVNGGTVSASAASGDRQISGEVTIAAGAKLTLTSGDLLNYNGSVKVHVHGTMEVEARQSIASTHKFYLYQGCSLVSSKNDTRGDFEFYQNNTIWVEDGVKPIVIDAYLGVRNEGGNDNAVFSADNQACIWVTHSAHGGGHLVAKNVVFIMRDGTYADRHTLDSANTAGGYVEILASTDNVLRPTVVDGCLDFETSSYTAQKVQFGTIRKGVSTGILKPVADAMTCDAPYSMKFLGTGLWAGKPGFGISIR